MDPDSTSITPSVQAVNTTAKVAKKVIKKKLTAKERRERGVTIHPLGGFLVLTRETARDREGGKLASPRIPRIRPCKQIPLSFLDRFHFSHAT